MSDEQSPDKDFDEHMAMLESTEIVQLVRRPDHDTVEIEPGDLDHDTVIAILARGLFRALVDEYMVEIEAYLEDDDDDDGDSPPSSE